MTATCLKCGGTGLATTTFGWSTCDCAAGRSLYEDACREAERLIDLHRRAGYQGHFQSEPVNCRCIIEPAAPSPHFAAVDALVADAQLAAKRRSLVGEARRVAR